jgi:hypothetical protein
MKNRKAWGLIGVLALLVLGTSVGGILYATQAGPYRDRVGWVVSAPWRLGAGPVTVRWGRSTQRLGWLISLGPLHVYVLDRPP